MFFSPAGKNVLLMFSMNENCAIVLGTMYMIFAKLPLHSAVIPCSRGTPKNSNTHTTIQNKFHYHLSCFIHCPPH